MGLSLLGLLIVIVGIGLMVSGIGAFPGIPLILLGAGLGLWGVRTASRRSR